MALLGQLWRSAPCPLWWDVLGAEGSPVDHSNLNTFFPGDSAARPVPPGCPRGPYALLRAPLIPPPAYSAPPTVGAAAASVPALGTRTFLNIPSFAGRAHPVDFSELLSYLVLPTEAGGHARAGRAFLASAAADG